ncbi:MAG: hypothetical protein K0R63_1730 [Rickettsiales bacterium]|jgi:hypothetical protein|nr:hypothetical protein [Rickettsiales bacterium]
MSGTSRVLTRLAEQLPENPSFEGTSPLADERYKRNLGNLLKDAIQKGCDFAQTDDGRVLITETKPVTYEYFWNEKKGKFERAKSGARARRLRVSNKLKASNSNNTSAAPAAPVRRKLAEATA